MPVITSKQMNTLRERLSKQAPCQMILLFDANTFQHCYSPLLKLFPVLKDIGYHIVPAGDSNKNIDQCIKFWQFLSDKKINRNAIVINIGGGMITDLGGYSAATFKRGISFINIPTSLLGMVDASVGGKTGINFSTFKNQVGIFAEPELVFIHTKFLETLPRNELHSGLAEMIKHHLLFNPNAMEEILSRTSISDWTSEECVLRNIEYKNEMVKQDYRDNGFRQCLNFGHTIGHAIESLSHHKKTPLLHGEAILLGMIEELKLSETRFNTPKEIRAMLEAIKKIYFPFLQFSYKIEKLISYLEQDKKNGEQISFSLLEDVGKPKLQISLSTETIKNELA